MTAAIPETLAHLTAPIETLQPFERNPRRGDLKRIIESLERNGQYRPIVVNTGTLTGRAYEVLAGNHTFLAAKALGWDEIAVTYVDVDDETAKRIVLVDNRASDVAGYDEDALAEILSELSDLEGTGYVPEDLDELLGAAGQTPGKDTEPAPKPKKPKARLGDVFVMGDHVLVCGDATDASVLDRLMGRRRADLIFTDPPYGMSYESAKLGGIKGDDLRGDDLIDMVQVALQLGVAHRKPTAAAYVWCSWRTYPEFIRALAGAELQPSACIVWSKGRPGPGSAHYRPEHEYCLFCRPEEEGDHELCVYCKGEEWSGGRGQSDVWEVPRDTGYVHPTQKPVALAEKAVTNSTRAGGVVLDLFGGSGSTLIACENLNRRARLVELDPGYVDVIVDRWERHAGAKAERRRG